MQRDFGEQVRALLMRHVREGYSALLGQHYCYLMPSPGRYPFQWFWDTCFHVLMLVELGECELAKRAFRSLFAMQTDRGFVGHMIFWRDVLPSRMTDVLQSRPTWQDLRPHKSALVQPPYAAQALLRLYRATEDRVFLGELYARVQRLHDWLAANRDFDGDGLLSIVSPFESGMDWKASYDKAVGQPSRKTPGRLYTSGFFWKQVAIDWSNFLLRYDLRKIREKGRFCVKDVGFNCAYALDLRAMEELAPIAGDDPRRFAERRARLTSSMLERMYDEASAAFYDLSGPRNEKLEVLTPTVFFPLALEEVDDRIAKRVLEAHFANEQEFATPVPLPTVAVSDPAFRRDESWYIWRGPMWALPNWFLYHAFRRRGFAAEARGLREALWLAVRKSGFREYYDPYTAQGHGAKDFTWPGLLLDMN